MGSVSLPFKHESNLLGALAHPTRLHILEVLRDGEVCVCHIQAVLDSPDETDAKPEAK